ncbi:winged helix-turn-helix domain-containing protein [Chitinophaga vietnamensis]|uniref:winged helix-turn-helix domain-containing protein n=1 Tax=Chitinophaga vietnamensis TaxID=2593957 RepID=UPI0011789655|nr:response regulator transcription factor [Chitinophaga vietnamensis]
MNILLLEGKLNLAESIIKKLEAQGYSVDFARDGINGKKMALTNKYNLIILNAELPGISGLEVYKSIRRLKIESPVLVLSDRQKEHLSMLQHISEPDNYLVRPFHLDDLLMRVSIACKTQPPEDADKSAHLEINRQSRSVIRSGVEIFLTNTELALLKCFLANRNKVLSREEIARNVWGADFDNRTNRVGVYIKYLRDKIDRGFPQHFIHTVVGMGYILKDD